MKLQAFSDLTKHHADAQAAEDFLLKFPVEKCPLLEKRMVVVAGPYYVTFKARAAGVSVDRPTPKFWITSIAAKVTFQYYDIFRGCSWG